MTLPFLLEILSSVLLSSPCFSALFVSLYDKFTEELLTSPFKGKEKLGPEMLIVSFIGKTSASTST